MSLKKVYEGISLRRVNSYGSRGRDSFKGKVVK